MIAAILKLFGWKPNVRRQIMVENRYDVKADADDDVKAEIYKSFLNKFAENQNHHQKIFIQFLSSVLIVIVAYVFVYTNTISPAGIGIHGAGDRLIYPDINSAIKEVNGNILSFSVKHLLGIYLFSQFVFLVLESMILNMGYGFRRDQIVVHKIRKKFLDIVVYTEIFGESQFKGYNKSWFNYLPSFNSNLAWAIFLLQIFFYASLFDYLSIDQHFADKHALTIVDHWLRVSFTTLKWILIAPILVTPAMYFWYFSKYRMEFNSVKKKKEEMVTKQQPTTKIEVSKT